MTREDGEKNRSLHRDSMEHHDEQTHEDETRQRSEGQFLVFENGKVRIKISGTWCKSCGICIAFCPPKVLEARDDGFPVATWLSKCTDCKLCELKCPDFAIMVEKAAKT